MAADVVTLNGQTDRRTELRFANALRLQGWQKERTRMGARWGLSTQTEIETP